LRFGAAGSLVLVSDYKFYHLARGAVPVSVGPCAGIRLGRQDLLNDERCLYVKHDQVSNGVSKQDLLNDERCLYVKHDQVSNGISKQDLLNDERCLSYISIEYPTSYQSRISP
jgi:hypothetical protein